jgi:hypothetical protein
VSPVSCDHLSMYLVVGVASWRKLTNSVTRASTVLLGWCLVFCSETLGLVQPFDNNNVDLREDSGRAHR